jgi:competence protein ComEC
MDFLHRTPFFRLFLPFVAGIIVFQYAVLFPESQLVVALLSVFFILSGIVISQTKFQFKFRWLTGFGIFMFLFVAGYFVSAKFEKDNSFQHADNQAIFLIELTENPILKENSTLCRIKTLEIYDKNSSEQTSGKAIIYIQKSSKSEQLQSGDRILLRATFHKPDGALNPNGFDYATYLKRSGIEATAYISDDNWNFAGKNPDFSIFRLAEQIQSKLLDVYKQFGISGDEFAVLAALTLGSKDALNPELRQNYTTSGGMHILAVSGLHVGIIYMVLGFLLSFLNRNRYLIIVKTVLIVILLWAYAFITGLPPSVIRSTIMFSMVAIGGGLDRKSLIYNTIFASAFLMLIYNPNFLYDVGFQLSYSAVLGIVYFQPLISKWFVIKFKPLKWAWDLTAVSLAAQLGTAPFSLYYFHQFANYFFITNLIAIPFAGFVIYAAVALFIFSSVPYISVAVAFVLQWLLKILNFAIQFIHDLPHSLSLTTIDFIQVILAYCTLILLAFYFQKKKFSALALSLSFILFFIIISFTNNYNTLKSKQVIVYSDNSNTHVDFIEGKTHYVFTTDSNSLIKTAQGFWITRKLEKPLRLTDNPNYSHGFIQFRGKKFLILTDSLLRNKYIERKISIDYLIVGNKIKPKINQILECVNPKVIVVDKTISKWYSEQISKICVQKQIRFYSVAEKGACILKLSD